MDTETAAQIWADTWTRAWPERDAEAIASLYSDGALYRSNAFGPPDSALGYLTRVIPSEEAIECWFGNPIVSGDRAAVPWWGIWTEDEHDVTYAGVTLLRFNHDGKVVDHRDYHNHIDGRQAPYSGW
jgi:hypothetical protein